MELGIGLQGTADCDQQCTQTYKGYTNRVQAIITVLDLKNIIIDRIFCLLYVNSDTTTVMDH